jgi:hypothetical protein
MGAGVGGKDRGVTGTSRSVEAHAERHFGVRGRKVRRAASWGGKRGNLGTLGSQSTVKYITRKAKQR